MGQITKRSVDELKPREKEYFFRDGQIPGFAVRVSKSGLKTYCLQYRADGRTRRLKLGTHGAITPNEARKLATESWAEIARGKDPSGAKQIRRRAPTVSDLCERFLVDYVPHHCKPSTAKEYRRCCDIFIRPALGTMKVDTVLRPDVALLHNKLRDKPYQANRVLGVISKMFNMAEIWGLRPDNPNPTRHVKKYKETKRERYLDLDEIERLLRVLDECVEAGTESIFVASAFKLLLLTGCRLSEIQKAKWAWVRGGSLLLPDAKNGARTVVLSEKAQAILRSLPRYPDNPYIIIGAIEGQHVTDLQKPWRRIRKSAGLEDVRIHDLRHTYASLAAAVGCSLPVIGKLLGHTQAQTTLRYAHLSDAVTRNAANEVGTLIQDFAHSPPLPNHASNVVYIPHAENNLEHELDG